MADVNVNNRGTDGGGSTMLIALLVLVVVVLVVWLVMRGGDEAEVDVDVPAVEQTEVNVPEQVDVEVKTSGEGTTP